MESLSPTGSGSIGTIPEPEPRFQGFQTNGTYRSVRIGLPLGRNWMADVQPIPPGQDRVTIVVVLTFDRPHLEQLWHDLSLQTYRPLEVLVVDNDSHDGSVEFVQAHPLPFSVRIIHKERNEGVTPAWNLALRNTQDPWVLLISPDCVFPPDLVQRMVDCAHARATRIPSSEAVGGVSPTFLWKGRPAASLDSPPHFHPRQRGLFPGVARDDEIFSYHGACGLLSTLLLKRLGGWDPRVNFGGDETDLGLQAHLLGYHFYTLRDVPVEHPYGPRFFAGKSGVQLRMRTDSIWFSLLKHGGITLAWRTIAYEAVTYLFWHRMALSPRPLAAQVARFLRLVPELAERRRQLRALWKNRVSA